MVQARENPPRHHGKKGKRRAQSLNLLDSAVMFGDLQLDMKSRLNVRVALVAALIVFVGVFAFWVGFTHFLHEFGRHNIDVPQDYPDLDMGRVFLIATMLAGLVALAAGILIGIACRDHQKNGEMQVTSPLSTEESLSASSGIIP